MYSIFILLLTSNCELTINQPKSLIVLHYFRHELINIAENLAKGEVPKLFSYKSDGCFKTIDVGELRDLQIIATELSTENVLFTDHLTL